MFKINCLNPISQVGLADLTGDFHITDKVDEAEGILVRSASMHEMELPDSLLAVARAGAGVNNIPLDKCAEKGIVVFNTPGANANGVKELVLAGMLLAARDIVGGIEWIKENASDADIAKTAEKQKKNYAGTEIAGKKLGVIGLGDIGVKVANAALHLGMDVYGYDPYLSVNAAWNLSRNVHHVEKVEEIYKECDYITIHVPLLDSTKGTINREAISQMKDGVVVINYARDLLVSETDMLEALKNGKVARYVSDFPNATTAGQPGVILTPHLGASTEESEDNCAKMAVEEIMDYLNNGNIKNSVNYPAIDMGPCDNKGRVAVFHKNQANMIAQFTAVFGAEKINISDMMNKSRGDYAVTLLDLDDVPTESLVEKLAAAEGVLRVRVVKG